MTTSRSTDPDSGATKTVLARGCRLRASIETITTGRAGLSGGSVDSLTNHISPRRGDRIMTRQETAFQQTGPIVDLLSLHPASSSRNSWQWKRKCDELLDCGGVGRSVRPRPQKPTYLFASSSSIPKNARIPAKAKRFVFLCVLYVAWPFSA